MSVYLLSSSECCTASWWLFPSFPDESPGCVTMCIYLLKPSSPSTPIPSSVRKISDVTGHLLSVRMVNFGQRCHMSHPRPNWSKILQYLSECVAPRGRSEVPVPSLRSALTSTTTWSQKKPLWQHNSLQKRAFICVNSDRDGTLKLKDHESTT